MREREARRKTSLEETKARLRRPPPPTRPLAREGATVVGRGHASTRHRRPRSLAERREAMNVPTDPETDVVAAKTATAICVQEIDAQCVLQFTLNHAACYALHRFTSRVIHRSELY